MSEEMHQLRERVAVTETVIRSHEGMLKEMRDAVLGINASLHVLTRLEEKIIKHQEADESLRERLREERDNRNKQARDFGERIGNLEVLMADLSNQTSLNSHGRDLTEKIFAPTVAAIVSGIIVAVITWNMLSGIVVKDDSDRESLPTGQHSYIWEANNLGANILHTRAPLERK